MNPSYWEFARTGLVIVGALVAFRQFRRASSKARFDYLRELQKLRRDLGTSYNDFLESFPILNCPELVSELSLERIQQAHAVSDAINELAELGEHNSVDRELFYDFFHSQLIRVEFLLRPFLHAERSRRGGRYGERLERVARQARIYSFLHYRNKPVRLPRTPPVVVFDPTDSLGRHPWMGTLVLRMRWRLRL